MFGSDKKKVLELENENSNLKQMLNSIDASSARIEFDTQGNIIAANDLFLQTFGYTIDDIKGQHHKMFLSKEYQQSSEYAQFWPNLAKGLKCQGQFLRFTKSGQEIWLEASYNAVKDSDGQVYKIVKYATDITERVNSDSDNAAMLEAIASSFAVITFYPDGTIIDANENFAQALGYPKAALPGSHHRQFVDDDYASSKEYSEFWTDLASGVKKTGFFNRICKDGHDIWIQAAYSPIALPGKKPHKIIKIASDISQLKHQEIELASLVKESLDVLTALSHGDLTSHVKGEYSGSLSSLKDALNQSISNLSAALTDISVATHSVNLSAKEVSEASLSLSGLTSKTAISVEQTNSAMQLTFDQVKKTLDMVNEAHESTTEQQSLIDAGLTLMDESLQAIQLIENSSKEIKDIVSLIDGIAFQTNLLALNAAVEAARAGDHGKGFAVVASEVRILAQKSAVASKDIKRLISQSAKQAQMGVDIVTRSSQNLKTVSGKSNEISETVTLLGEYSQSQFQSMEKIGREMDSIDSVTQQNAAMVEETSATADNLSGLSNEVLAILSNFSLKKDN